MYDLRSGSLVFGSKMRSGYGYGGKTINLCQNNILTPKIPSVFASKLPELDVVDKHHATATTTATK